MSKKKPSAKKSSSENFLQKYQHNLIPSSIGALIAYLFTGVLFLAGLVFAAVWVGNMIGRSLHKK